MLERLLLAVDDSAHSRKAVPAAAELALAGGGSVHVLHVREVHYPLPPTVTGDRPEDAQRLVDGVVAELGAGMVVVGSQGRTSLGGLLLGSVAHKVIQLSTCPVLVVRDEQSLETRHHDVLRAQTRFQA